MSISDVLATVGIVVAIIGVPAAWLTWRGFARERSAGTFLEIRARARRDQAQLTEFALSAASPEFRSDSIPMLTLPGWIPPVPLGDITLDWKDTVSGDGLAEARARAADMMPRNPVGGHYAGYSEALVKIGGMEHLYNGNVYRPVEVAINQQGMRISFTAGKYFDHLDTSEVLSYEAALVNPEIPHGALLEGHYRRWLESPFDLVRRGTSLGVITLTVRRLGPSSSFFMHQRDGNHVEVGSETIHVIPAGEFTPADVSLESMEADFNLWHTIMREYAEEFLDMPEAYGRGGRPLDYEKDQPFKRLNAARRSGALTLHVLGIGLDPLTWKPEILLACVIEARTFDRLFSGMVERTREGIILSGPEKKGLPFERETVERYAKNRNTRCSARACLQLAWRHRVNLGLA